MIGMVLVTHGRLAAEFIAALEHVVGAQAQTAAVCIGPEDDMELRRQDIYRCIAEVNDGSGVVLLTDMFGGTPSNLAIAAMEGSNIEVIAGINLPMLIKLASLRQTASLPAAVLGAQEAGRKYINVASQLLGGKARMTVSSGGDGGEVRQTVTICNRRGLHARAAAKFVTLADSFRADIQVSRAGSLVSGRSIMGLMMLTAGPGSEILISATGPEAGVAVAAIVALVEAGFGEN